MRILLLLSAITFSVWSMAQDSVANVATDSVAVKSIDTDSAILHQQIDMLYEAAKRSFGNIKAAKIGSADGKTMYKTTLQLHGSTECVIEVDSERSHVYSAKFKSKSLEEAKSLQENLTTVVFKRTQPEGFKRGKGSDFKYYKYQMNTVEFDSDNIDEMGKRPSFNVGIIAESDDTYTVVFSAVDPLWK